MVSALEEDRVKNSDLFGFLDGFTKVKSFSTRVLGPVRVVPRKMGRCTCFMLNRVPYSRVLWRVQVYLEPVLL